MRSIIVQIGGDYYYKKISIEETKKFCLITLPRGQIKNEQDAKNYVNKTVSKAIPLNTP